MSTYGLLLENISRNIFKDKTVQRQSNNPRTSSRDSEFNDYTESSTYKTNGFFSEGERKIELLVYQDAFETTIYLYFR